MGLSNKQKNYIDKNAGKKSPRAIAVELRLEKSEVEEYLSQKEASAGATAVGSAPQKASKKGAFYAIMIAIPFLFFILLEAGLRMGNYRGNLDLFIYPTIFDGEYALPNPNFTSRYFFATSSVPSPSDDVFLVNKPENGFRVFVLGGSTANGYPYGYNGSFSRLFRDIIQDLAPDSHVEVVNVATSAINTYSIYDQVDEILEQKPDAILIYGGHNEYYGALGVGSSETFGAFPGFVRSYLRLQRYKTFLLLRDGIVRASGWFGSMRSTAADRAPGGTLMQRMVGQQQIPLEGDLYELGKLQFESNMNAILRKFERNDIPVFLGTLTSNLKDQPPFISVATDKHPAADDVFGNALVLADEERFDEAFDQFVYAKDLDALRFRAPESFNEIIRSMAVNYANTTVVPVHEAFLRESENRLIGFDLMTEHLHPNVPGYQLMGRAFAESFIEADLPGISINRNALRDWQEYHEMMHMTEFDVRVGDHRIMLLKNSWPFVPQRDPRGYPNNYSFVSPADSMAFKVVNDNVRWDQAKVRLASYYEDNGELDKALAEYKGLMRAQPYNDSPFIFGARIWLARNNFDEAFPLLEQAYAIEPSAFTTKMLGAIEVDRGNTSRGIELLEESLALDPNDAQTLFNLSGAYALEGDFSRSDEVLTMLQAINPNFPGAAAWRQQLNIHLRQQR